ncbi:MAG TPA: anti-sigma factor antagonist [Acidiferrobacteraceae bacterium]|nr:anti-sigma factor antagonist [Acidiferrobacteraceae bacterium]
MTYKITQYAGYSVIHLEGDVDLSTSPNARKIILECIEAKNNVLVDLSGVDYIDSSGVASLVEGYQLAKSGNTEFGLVNVSQAALDVLQLARLDTVFPIHLSLDAVAKVAKEPG